MPTPVVIKSLQHPLVKHLVKLRTNKQYRQQERRTVLSSGKIIQEVAPLAKIRSILVSEESELYSSFTFDSLYLVSPEILKKVSGLETPTDCAAEVDLPAPSPLEGCRRLLVLDQVSDPGNVGTLARTALAFGWDGLYLTEGSADPFNEKTLRASRAALFTLAYRLGSVEDLSKLLSDRQVLVADTTGVPVRSVVPSKNLALVLSNEAHGPSPSIARQGERITIPMPGEIESLNVAVAGGILTFWLSSF